jgi:hypothetical protein
MYNTNFIVKYNDIENELLHKLKTNTEADSSSGFSEEDVLDVCDKLYRDELTSVFYAENIMDGKIDQGINYILEKLIENIEFKNILETLKTTYFVNDNSRHSGLSDEEILTAEKNALECVFLFLFSKHIFYLTHNCICQQLTTNKISNNLLEELKDKFTLILCNK